MNIVRSLPTALAVLLLGACAALPAPILEDQRFVMASAETGPVGGRGDTADDPALWRHPDDPGRSLVLGTNKREGLVVFSLDGTEVQRLPIGLINNVDVRQSPERPFDLAVASNDQVNAISVFLVDRATGAVTHHGDIPTGKVEPYGICSAREAGQDIAGVTYKDGTVEIWAVSAGPSDLAGRLIRTFKLDTQIEGCVFDEPNGTLIVGEEEYGLWSFAYREDTTIPILIDTVGSGTGLVADVEGVSVWRGANGEGWLVASAQEEDRFVVYDRQAPHAHRGSFSIVPNEALGIDGVSHTDGLDIHSGALPGYPRGLLIVQDDANPGKGENQNFKLVSWADVEAALALPVLAVEE